jgi:hypothetical protein
MHDNWNFSLDSEASFDESDLHSIRVDRLEITRSQLPMYLEERAKNLIGNLLVQQFAHTVGVPSFIP